MIGNARIKMFKSANNSCLMLYANKVPKCVPPGCLNTLNPNSARKSPKPNNLLKIKTAKWIGFHVLECVPKNTSRNMLFQSIFDAGEIASMQFGDFPVESDYQYFIFTIFTSQRKSTYSYFQPLSVNPEKIRNAEPSSSAFFGDNPERIVCFCAVDFSKITSVDGPGNWHIFLFNVAYSPSYWHIPPHIGMCHFKLASLYSSTDILSTRVILFSQSQLRRQERCFCIFP